MAPKEPRFKSLLSAILGSASFRALGLITIFATCSVFVLNSHESSADGLQRLVLVTVLWLCTLCVHCLREWLILGGSSVEL